MTLIKSKINSLGWLNSAIYVFVVGGVILSSTPVLAAILSKNGAVLAYEEDETSLTFNVRKDTFGNGEIPFPFMGKYWKGTFNIKESNGSGRDDLLIRVYLQHIHKPHQHQGDSALGGDLNLNFRLTSSLSTSMFDSDDDRAEHPGIKHFDQASGILTARRFDLAGNTGIRDWSLVGRAEHAVPEPTTMLGAALALGWGGWMKRKNSIK